MRYLKKNINPVFLRHHLSEHLFNTVRYFFKIRERIQFVTSHHHLLMAATLMRVIKGEIKRLIINIPPSYSKTEIAVIGFIAYGFIINKECKFIHTSYSDSLALLNSNKVRDIVLSDEFKELFGLQIRHDSSGKKRWDIAGGGGLYATSAGGQITGFRAGKSKKGFQGAIIVDDPIKPIDAHSQLKVEGVNEWYNDTLRSRTDNRDTPVIIIMQRLAENDLSGFLLGGGSNEKWHHLCLPGEIT